MTFKMYCEKKSRFNIGDTVYIQKNLGNSNANYVKQYSGKYGEIVNIQRYRMHSVLNVKMADGRVIKVRSGSCTPLNDTIKSVINKKPKFSPEEVETFLRKNKTTEKLNKIVLKLSKFCTKYNIPHTKTADEFYCEWQLNPQIKEFVEWTGLENETMLCDKFHISINLKETTFDGVIPDYNFVYIAPDVSTSLPTSYSVITDPKFISNWLVTERTATFTHEKNRHIFTSNAATLVYNDKKELSNLTGPAVFKDTLTLRGHLKYFFIDGKFITNDEAEFSNYLKRLELLDTMANKKDSIFDNNFLNEF